MVIYITAILDWEYFTHGFDNVELDFISKEYWYDNIEKSLQLQERFNLKKNELSWLKKSSGKEVRSYLFPFIRTANQIGFFASSWFPNCDKLPRISVRQHINKHAIELAELLKMSDSYFNFLKIIKKKKNSSIFKISNFIFQNKITITLKHLVTLLEF